MLTEKRTRELMSMVLDEMELSKAEDDHIHPKVGAVIVDENGKVIAKAHRGERGKGDHAEFIAIAKAREIGFEDFATATIFATLEPCTHRGHDKTPCAERIVKAGFQRVFIGALDPNPVIVGHGETYLRDKIATVERFPSNLERQIRESNMSFWGLYAGDHLPSNSLYISVRVSDIILRKLKSAGVEIDGFPSEDEYSIKDLAAYVHGKGNFRSDRKKLYSFLEEARADAFDQKYSGYTYEKDARRIEERWKKEFVGILKNFRVYDYPKRKLLVVGVGNGIEGIGLFEDCLHFTGVDIAPDSLRKAQSLFPRATFHAASAESLEPIPDQSQDIYLSLRTYQSAFFDTREAIRQAYRVLSPGGICIISIANAYLEGNTFVRGLLPHGSKVVDLDRAHELIDSIRHSLTKMRFEDIGVHTGKAEEYVFGRKRH